MTDFEILIQNGRTENGAYPRRISMRLGDACLTRLVRRGSHEPDDWLEAPPVPLAFWFIDNWWRLRWEPAPYADLNAEWRLAHHLSSVGAGYHWPNVSIWGEGSRVGFAVHADANNLQPSLKFVAQPRLNYVPSSTVEDAIDRFVGHVLKHVGDASDGLDAEYRQLQAERTDPTVATWRKLEAMLGFDPDDAPDGLVGGLETLTERYGSEPLQEAALAHQGERATEAINNCIKAAESSNVLISAPFAFDTLDPIKVGRSSLQPPWRLAVRAANQLRHWLNVPPGPIRNTRLSEIVGTNVDYLGTKRRSTFDIPYALRLRQETGSKLALRSTWSHTRRFETLQEPWRHHLVSRRRHGAVVRRQVGAPEVPTGFRPRVPLPIRRPSGVHQHRQTRRRRRPCRRSPLPRFRTSDRDNTRQQPGHRPSLFRTDGGRFVAKPGKDDTVPANTDCGYRVFFKRFGRPTTAHGVAALRSQVAHWQCAARLTGRRHGGDPAPKDVIEDDLSCCTGRLRNCRNAKPPL